MSPPVTIAATDQIPPVKRSIFKTPKALIDAMAVPAPVAPSAITPGLRGEACLVTALWVPGAIIGACPIIFHITS
jgi:hypothetical protein